MNPSRRRTPLALSLCCAALAAVLSPASAGTGDPPRPGRAVEGEIVVRFRAGTGTAEEAEARSAAGARARRELPLSDVEVLEVEGPVDEAIERLEASADVLYAEPNYIFEGAVVPNDTSFGEQWGLDNFGQPVSFAPGRPDADIDAPEAWDTTTGDPAVVVAVVDSGVALDHPDLSANASVNPGESGGGAASNGVDDDHNGFVDDHRGWDFVGDDNAPDDEHGHGTHVAGILAAAGDNGFGVAGASWSTRILPVRVLGADNFGSLDEIASGIAYAGDMGVPIANVSIQADVFTRTMRDAIKSHPDTLYVIAAGNGGLDLVGDDNDETPTYPCSYGLANILCVAATDADDRLTSFSNFGTRAVDVTAPGESILSTWLEYGYPYSEPFATKDLSGWVTGGKRDTWGTGKGRFSKWALEDSPGGKYRPRARSWARTEKIDLAGMRACTLRYNLVLKIKEGDRLLVQGSRNAKKWRRVSTWPYPTFGVAFAEDRIGRFDGGDFYLRFKLVTDRRKNADGAEIDDISIDCISSDFTDNAYSYLDGTSMAAPMASGAAALAAAAAPGLTSGELKSALMDSTDFQPSLAGYVKTGGRINAARLVALVTQGPGPQQPSKACVPNWTPRLRRVSSASPAAPGATTGGWTREVFDTRVYEDVDLAYDPAGTLHVAGSTGDGGVAYGVSGSMTIEEDLDLVDPVVRLALASDGTPLLNYNDRIPARTSDGDPVQCESNVLREPGGQGQVADAVSSRNGSFAVHDVAIDASDDSVHRVFTKGVKDKLFYALDGGTPVALGMKKVDGARIGAANGTVFVAARSKGGLSLISGPGTGAVREEIAARARSWDLDVGASGDVGLVWTTRSGKIRLFNGTGIARLDQKAEHVAVARGSGGTLHVAVATIGPRCSGFGCREVAYLTKSKGSPVEIESFGDASSPGYVNALAIAVSEASGEVAIAYGEPRSGELLVRRAGL